MAHKKAGGSTAWGRDSHGKRLGIKIFEGAWANPGNILVRQRGAKYSFGQNVKKGGDDTLYSAIAGFVHFTRRMQRKFDGKMREAVILHVIPQDQYVSKNVTKTPATA